jgi:hypothetical protein
MDQLEFKKLAIDTGRAFFEFGTKSDEKFERPICRLGA